MEVLLRSLEPVCGKQNCAKWAKKYMGYCLCSPKDGVSLTLGLISVISWGVAEVPQIITSYKEKSTEGLSIAFLVTWIIGDLFNVIGCLMEPSTLPTQYYTALLYTMTTLVLFSQTIYYGHIYPRLRRGRCRQEGEEARKSRREHGATDLDDTRKSGTGATNIDREDTMSSPIPLPASSRSSSPGKELYFTSARSLSSSCTPPAGSFLAPKMTPKTNAIEEPLLGGARQSSNTKNMLCVVSLLMFTAMLNLHRSSGNFPNLAQENKTQAFVMRVGRRLLQASTGVQEDHIEGDGMMGNLLGWAMAAIYMGGRLPQICLNMRRGHVEGLSPFMFIFALVGNSTYVGSILVSSVEWSKIRPNLPWLVDAGGCVLLDIFILLQFLYYRYGSSKKEECKQQQSYVA